MFLFDLRFSAASWSAGNDGRIHFSGVSLSKALLFPEVADRPERSRYNDVTQWQRVGSGAGERGRLRAARRYA